MTKLVRWVVATAAIGVCVIPPTAALGAPLSKPVIHTAEAPRVLSPRITTAAWFQPDPLCSTPLGCGVIPLPALSPYPQGTFHISTALGRQTARAFIGVKLDKQAQAARGGTLSIPLDTNSADGSVAPDTATINVCVIYQKLTDVEGGFDGAPSPNCLPAAPAKYVAKPAPHLVANLDRLGGKLAGVTGFALLPAQAVPTSAWHVVFRLPTGKVPPSARPRLTLLVGKPPGVPQPAHHQAGTARHAVPINPMQVLPALPPSSVNPGTPSDQAPTVAPPAAQAGHWVTVGDQYPEVWLLPIVLVVLLPYTVRAMTKDLSRTWAGRVEP